ncbi:MAG: terpene cyclase/mutase family protein, partial [Pirellulales bacterium]|nr:terpene cyclase/mutase family protein [Pirellulales bacterium]
MNDALHHGCIRRLTVALVLCVFLGCSKPPKESNQEPVADDPRAASHDALQKAAEFLVSQQSADDGNWYSEVYGKFNKANQSVAPTAFVVYALAHLPDDLRKPHEPTIRKALDRLRGQITEKGFVGDVDGAAHYPTYTTGMVLATYHRLGWDLPAEDRDAMIRYIESAQLNHTRGWTAEDGHFGGWDLVGDQVIERQVHGPG